MDPRNFIFLLVVVHVCGLDASRPNLGIGKQARFRTKHKSNNHGIGKKAKFKTKHKLKPGNGTKSHKNHTREYRFFPPPDFGGGFGDRPVVVFPGGPYDQYPSRFPPRDNRGHRPLPAFPKNGPYGPWQKPKPKDESGETSSSSEEDQTSSPSPLETTTPKVSSKNETSADETPSTKSPSEEVTYKGHNLNPPHEGEQCGKTNVNPRKRIVNGLEIIANSIPWQAGLKYSSPTDSNIMCGGSILTHYHILSAAHCEEALPAGNVTAVVGQHDQTKREHEIEYQVECVIPHPKYKTVGHAFDIALYITRQPMKYSKWVQPVCIERSERDYVGKEMKVSGWGKLDGTEESDGSPTLQSAIVKGIPWDDCKKVYEGDLTEHNFCAIGSKDNEKTVVDSCSGDSGGPLTITEGSIATVVGVVNFGAPHCNNITQPGVYASVYFFLNWLDKHGVMNTHERPKCPAESEETTTEKTESEDTEEEGGYEDRKLEPESHIGTDQGEDLRRVLIHKRTLAHPKGKDKEPKTKAKRKSRKLRSENYYEYYE